MYCRRCGNYYEPGERFCSKCGAPLGQSAGSAPAGQSPRPGKNSNKKLLILLVVLVSVILMLIAGIVAMLVIRDKPGRSNERTTHSAAEEPAQSPEATLSLDQLETLRQIQESMKAVEEVSHQFDNDNGYVPEELRDEAIAAVYDAALTIPEVLSVTKDENGVLIEVSEGPDYVYSPAIEGVDEGESSLEIATMQPYFTKNYEQNYALDHYAPDSCAEQLSYDDPRWEFGANADDENVDLERLLSLDDYKMILWHGHGGFSADSGYFLCTQIEVTPELLCEYPMLNKETAFLTLGNDLSVRPAFFRKFYGNNAFENAFIYIATCHSGQTSELTDVFVDKGAAVVLVNSDTIYRDYNLNMLRLIVESFCLGNRGSESGPVMERLGYTYSEEWTIGDSLRLAKEQFGEQDLYAGATVYYAGQPGVDDLTYHRWMSAFNVGDKPIDPENLVRDYYTFVRSDVVSGLEDWENDEYHIPEIEISSADVSEINQELKDAYLRDAQTRAGDPYSEYGDWQWAKVTYQWAVNGDILSLLVEAYSAYGDYLEYHVYNVSVSEGTRISDEVVIGAAGWSQADYTQAVREALLSRYWDITGPMLERNPESGMLSELELLFNATLTYCDEAQPYLSENGDLMIAGKYGVPAGGGVAACLIDLGSYVLSSYYSEEFVVPERSAPPEGDRLEFYRWWMRGYDPGDGYAVIHCLTADVTRDGEPELILVEQNGDLYRGRVYRPEPDGSLLVLQELSGATSHVGNFFGWYLKRNGNGYDLVKEDFTMWQGLGTCSLSVYYLTEDGDMVSVEFCSAKSHGETPVTEEDMRSYRRQVSEVLHQSMLLGYDQSEGDGQHLEIDEALILSY